MAVRDFIRWRYTTNGDVNFCRRADAFITAQGGAGTEKVGGEAAADGDLPMPSNYKPRTWVGVDPATGYKGRVVIYTEDAPAWTDDTVTIQVRDGGGTPHTLHLRNRIGERLGLPLG